MTVTPMLLSRRAAAFCALVAIAATFLLAGATVAQAAGYPSSIRNAFNKSCIKAAAAGGQVSKSDATKYCNSALVCIEGKLTLAQFAKVTAKNKVVVACEKAAAKKVFS